MKSNNIKCILFDLDNTLWDFDGNADIALKQLFSNHQLASKTGKSEEEFLVHYRAINAEFWKQYEQGQIDKETLRTQRFIDTLTAMGLAQKDQPSHMWKEYLEICPTIPNLIPNALEVLKSLKSKYIIGLLTNGFQKTQETKIKYSGILEFIDFMISSEKFGTPKPNKAIFDFALSTANVSSKECIYIGDNLVSDVEGGLNAGIKTAWFTEKMETPIDHELFIGCFNKLVDFHDYIVSNK